MSIDIQNQIKSLIYRVKQNEDKLKELSERLEPLEKKHAENKKTLGLPKNV